MARSLHSAWHGAIFTPENAAVSVEPAETAKSHPIKMSRKSGITPVSVLAGVVVGVVGHADLPVAPGVQLVPVQAALAEQVTADGAHGGGLEPDPARAAPAGQLCLLDGPRRQHSGPGVVRATMAPGPAQVRGRVELQLL